MATNLSKTAINFKKRYCEQNYDTSISYNIYKQETKNCEPLDAENERSLFTKLNRGSESEKSQAFDRIVKANQPLVQLCARKYASNDMVMDYINEANIALISAINTFDLSLGYTFCTYATRCIVNHYNRYSASLNGQINIKRCGADTIKINKEINKFVQENERYPEPFEIEDMIAKGDYPRLNKNNVNLPNYVDFNCTSEDGENYNKLIEIESAYNTHYDIQITDYANKHEMDYITNYIIGKLDEKIQNGNTENIKNGYKRKRDIIVKHFGLYGEKPHTIKEIAELYEISATRAQQIISSTIETLKKEVKHAYFKKAI